MARTGWTYILECSDGSFYVGSTSTDVNVRVWEHNHTPYGAEYTRRRRPVRLAWAGQFPSVQEAFAFEKQVQGWSRKKRQALIDGRMDRLPALSSRIRDRRESVEVDAADESGA